MAIFLCAILCKIVVYFVHNSLSLNPFLVFHPSPILPSTGNYWFVLYICESVSVLLWTFIFWFSHISDNLENFSFFVHIITLSVILSRSIYIVAGDIIFFLLFFFFLWLNNILLYIYIYTHTPYLFYTFIYWGAFRLLPCLGYCA